MSVQYSTDWQQYLTQDVVDEMVSQKAKLLPVCSYKIITTYGIFLYRMPWRRFINLVRVVRNLKESGGGIPCSLTNLE